MGGRRPIETSGEVEARIEHRGMPRPPSFEEACRCGWALGEHDWKRSTALAKEQRSFDTVSDGVNGRRWDECGWPWEVDIGGTEVGVVFTFIFAGCCGFMYWMILQMEANK